MLVYFSKHSLSVSSEIKLSLIKIPNAIAPYDINIFFPCVLYILNCYHMYSILNISLTGFLSLKICPAVRTSNPSFYLFVWSILCCIWCREWGLSLLCATETSPTVCSLCSSKKENAQILRRHALSHGQLRASTRAVTA